MKTKTLFFLPVIVLVLLGAGCAPGEYTLKFGDWTKTWTKPGMEEHFVTSNEAFLQCQKNNGVTATIYPRQCVIGKDVLSEEYDRAIYVDHDNLISLDEFPVEPISDSLTVTGEARGYWFFEASFPVILEDVDGNEISTGIATAEGEWMTEEFVPFTVTLTVPPEEAYTLGKLRFVKDNPSGLPENDDEMWIPVTFGE